MGKNKASITFDKEFLDNLVNDESSCVEVKEQNYHLALHPFHLNNINESVKDILNQGISRYDKKLGGILLGYRDIKLLSNAGAVSNDSFFIHVDVAAAFYLFKPEVDKVLTGTVNKKSKDHVGCLVHKTFNVSLPKPAEVDDEDNDDWLGSKVQLGQDISFRITFMNLEARLPYIRAEFVAILSEPDSGFSTSEEIAERKPNKKIIFDSNSENELEVVEVKKKKKKKRKQEDSDEEVQNVKKYKYEDESFEGSSNKQKKSKHKRSDTSGLISTEIEEHNDPEISMKKKKSKHKRSISESVKEVDNAMQISIKKELMEEAQRSSQDENRQKRKHKHSYRELEDERTERHKHKNSISDQPEWESSHKKKKSKHSSENIKSNPEVTSKKTKKIKQEYSLEELQNAALQEALNSFSEPSDKPKKEKKSKKHHENDLDVTLPDLNLSNLFNEDFGHSSRSRGNFLMADQEDRTVKQKFASTSYTLPSDSMAFELPSDSDLESVLNQGTKRKRKSHKVEAESIKKRRRSSSSDEFEMPKVKRKIK